MVDIIDVVLAKKMSTQGQVEAIAADARSAVKNAQSAVEQVNAINEQAEALATRTETLSNQVEDTLEEVENALAQIDTSVITPIDDELDKFVLSLDTVSGETFVSNNLIAEYPSEKTETIQNIIKMYKASGQNEDGTMTQKAITQKFEELEDKIDNIPYNPQSPDEPTIDTSEILGLEIDYINKIFTRTDGAENKTMGTDFNVYPMYSGRLKCNVNNEGKILAWYGDSNYIEDGSNGQIMYYQPKFYYKRTPLATTTLSAGRMINKEKIEISYKPQTGFKLHPLFIKNGVELDYVLVSAYEGSGFNSTTGYDQNGGKDTNINTDLLSSIANIKPISGERITFNANTAEAMAQRRGENWHITNLTLESANQMLQLIEYGTLNGQNALGQGLSKITDHSSYCCASLTGSTASLGNNTGVASATINDYNGNQSTLTGEGQVAITYRGYENPWGNIWRIIGGLIIEGNGNQQGGTPKVCLNYNYSNTDNYTSIAFNLPNDSSWISNFGYDYNNDWVFLPIQAQNANSALPIGDSVWTNSNLNNADVAAVGGAWMFEDRNGPFYYAFDRGLNYSARTYGARLMFIPNKDANYTYNYSLWKNKMGVDS